MTQKYLFQDTLGYQKAITNRALWEIVNPAPAKVGFVLFFFWRICYWPLLGIGLYRLIFLIYKILFFILLFCSGEEQLQCEVE